jgi:hypothetical protein
MLSSAGQQKINIDIWYVIILFRFHTFESEIE